MIARPATLHVGWWLVFLGCLSPGCGARGTLLDLGAAPADAAGTPSAPALRDASGRPPRHSLDASAPRMGDAASRPGDARPEGAVGGLGDARPDRPDATVAGASDGSGGSRDSSTNAASDALSAPDCSCPPGDYFIDATFGTEGVHLAGPYALELYCRETAVQMEHPPCSQVYSLTGCRTPSGEAPCVYLSLNRSTGPLIGFYVDSTGQTWDMVAVSMALDPFAGRTSTGTFEASFTSRGDASILRASGSFHACTTRMPSCAP